MNIICNIVYTVGTIEIIGSKQRLEILRCLSERDMYISELMEFVQMDGRTANHHLNVLEEAGIVSSCMEGGWRYFRPDWNVRLEISRSPERRFIAHLLEQTNNRTK